MLESCLSSPVRQWSLWGQELCLIYCWIPGAWHIGRHSGCVITISKSTFPNIPHQPCILMSFSTDSVCKVSLMASFCSTCIDDISTTVSHELAFVHGHTHHLISLARLGFLQRILPSSLAWKLPDPSHPAHSLQIPGSKFCPHFDTQGPRPPAIPMPPMSSSFSVPSHHPAQKLSLPTPAHHRNA